MPEKKLPPSAQEELDLFRNRLDEFGQQIAKHYHPGLRARDVAVLAIEFFDMIDSVDHRTSSELGGTDEIQEYARLGRAAARDFTESVPDTD